MSFRCILIACIGALLLATSAVVRADDDPYDAEEDDPYEHEDPDKLFNEGVVDMKAQLFASACPAIARSFVLDPLPGTLFTLAECEAKWGHLTAAVARYNEYLSLIETLPPAKRLRHREREEIARAQLSALDSLTPRLELVLPENAPRNTTVKQDGIVIDSATLGIPRIVEPGVYVVTTQEPGGPVAEVRITVNRSEKKRVVLPFKPLPRSEAKPTMMLEVPLPRDKSPGPRHVGAFVGIGVGSASLATSVILAGLAASSSDQDSGTSLTAASVTCLGIGGAGIGAGIALLLTETRTVKPASASSTMRLVRARPNSSGVSAGVLSLHPERMLFGVHGLW